jgi:uncharacterized membrane protein YgaE (UPF0421/DUF939 family)
MEVSIGPRMLKTGMAVTLTLVITELLAMEYAVFGAIASVIAMKPSVMRSFTYLKEVVIGNSIAVIFSLLGIFLLGSHPLSVGLVVIISIAVNVRLGLNKTVSLTVLTVIAIMLQSEDSFNAFYAMSRVGLVVIGVGSSFIVNSVVFPPNHRKALYNLIKTAADQTLFLLRVIPNQTMNIPTRKVEDRELEKRIAEIKDYYDILVEERNRLFRRNRVGFFRSIVIYKYMIRVLEKQYTLITHLENTIDEIEKMSSQKNYIIKKLISEIANYSENVFLLYEDKIELDQNLQQETKNAMRVTINNLIAELQGSDYEKWTYVFPVANSLIELYGELEKLERLIRNKGEKIDI